MWNSSQIQKITAFWTQSKFQRCMNVSLFLFLLKIFNITKQSQFGGKICMVTYYETWKRHMYIYKHTQLNLKGDNGRLTNRINTLQIFDTSILQLSQTSLLFQFQEDEKEEQLTNIQETWTYLLFRRFWTTLKNTLPSKRKLLFINTWFKRIYRC